MVVDLAKGEFELGRIYADIRLNVGEKRCSGRISLRIWVQGMILGCLVSMLEQNLPGPLVLRTPTGWGSFAESDLLSVK
jgi:hypothetical protein